MNKSWKLRWNDVLSKVMLITSSKEQETFINEITVSSKSKVVAFVNAHAMNLMVHDQALYQSMLTCDYLLRDGVGMSILYNHLGKMPGLNMNGTDLIPKLLEKFGGRSLAIWGTQEPYLSQAATMIANKYSINIVSTHHGFESNMFYVGLSKKMKPDLILLGMGMPKQEEIANELKIKNSNALIICGGAIVDFLGGKVTRAPYLFRKLGLEWFYRLISEPRRLFRRYIFGNPLFIIRTLLLRI